jgi:hypothetical protein
MTDPRPARFVALGGLTGGFVVWAAAFALLYAVQATGCRLGWHDVAFVGAVSVQRAVLVALFLAFVAAQVGVLLAISAWRDQRDRAAEGLNGFLRSVALGLALAALAATPFTFAGVAFLTAC